MAKKKKKTGDEFQIHESQSPEGARRWMKNMWGPGHVDQAIRRAISACWMSLPKEKQTPAEVEKMFRRLVDRALKDFTEDAAAFGG